ncbi:protein phosphatase CheZ [Thiomicrorhabdus sp.]|uniref:protein phosphatase CheZ n=1 Tax=Thiomicrorhabdus sp. TaxID=2039724 RepID=UPI002AA8A557|nr:protein phosphatase CheZ [Thiomicrorhabdus sp.]
MAISNQIDLQQAKQLVEALENQEHELAANIVDEMTQIRENELFQQLNTLTSNLHLTLNEIDDDSLLMQTKHDIPDATERLEYVIQATEQASNQTLDTAERALQSIESISQMLQSNQHQEIQAELSKISEGLTEIMLAQSYQDLTGQVLNRVIFVISSLEHSLIQLIENSGHDYHSIPERAKDADEQKSQEMQGVGPNVTTNAKKDIVESQDDIDDLLSDLGI